VYKHAIFPMFYSMHSSYISVVFVQQKNSRKFIVTIPVRNPWKGFLLERAKDLVKWGTGAIM